MSLLVVQDLTRAPWFEGLDLTLAAGEVAVLRGPSGSGKTLLLRALADLDPVERGARTCDGWALERCTPQAWRRRVRLVAQRPAALADTVAEHVERALEALDLPRREPDLADALRRLGHGLRQPGAGLAAPLDPRAATADLSGGERQRLALHVALRSGARVLLLDEPTSALDAPTAREVEAAVRAFVAEGNAALWVTHEDGLAARLGAREVRPW